MRNELVHQNQLAVQPLVLAALEREDVAFDQRKLHVILRNIGRGPAFFVCVDDFSIIAGDNGTSYRLHISPIDCIGGGEKAYCNVARIARTAEGSEQALSLGTDPVAALDPDSANRTHILAVRYEDIDHGKYVATTQMGKSGIQLLNHGRE